MTTFSKSLVAVGITAIFLLAVHQIIPAPFQIYVKGILYLLLSNFFYRIGFKNGEDQGVFDAVAYINQQIEEL